MPSALDSDLSPEERADTYKTERESIHDDTVPDRPPYSPISPSAQLPSQFPINSGAASGQTPFIRKPPPVPLSEAENSDAIALRAAISVLQVQKEKSKRDIQALQQLKEAAAREPEVFTKDLLDGKLRHEQHSGHDPLRATFETDLPDDEDEDEATQAEGGNSRKSESKFGTIPSAQNVFRCPPVNWSKYHVVGESLDRMHEEQRKRPSGGDASQAQIAPAREAVIAATYSPFHDTYLDQQPQSMKPPSAKK